MTHRLNEGLPFQSLVYRLVMPRRLPRLPYNVERKYLTLVHEVSSVHALIRSSYSNTRVTIDLTIHVTIHVTIDAFYVQAVSSSIPDGEEEIAYDGEESMPHLLPPNQISLNAYQLVSLSLSIRDLV